jgi:enoyl-CoA hydratase
MIEREPYEDAVVLRLQHGKVNALDVDLLTALADEVGDLTGDAPPLVLAGAASSFSAGVDLRQVAQGGKRYAERLLPALSRAFVTLFTYPGPLVAAVNGHALAGGCIIACACDRRLMAEGTGTIGVTELLVGVPFPTSALEILRFTVGDGRAQDLALTGRRLQPAEALALGLVDEVVPAVEVEERALVAARQFGAVPPEVFRITKRQLRRETVARIERHRRRDDAQVEALWSDEAAAARVAAFLEAVTGGSGS